jgi:hypothetical protein
MKRLIFLVMILEIFCRLPRADADALRLKNGNVIEGIIVRDTDKIVEIEVFLGARITFSKEEVTALKKWSDRNNQELKGKWLKERKERRDAELARQAFEARQKARGLIKYRGTWLKEEEKDKIKTREIIDEVLQAKIESGEIVASGRKRSDVARSLLAKGSWKNRQTEHFIIYYEDLMQSKIVADRCEYYYEKISYDLDYDKLIHWPQKCEVFIVSSEDKWEEYMQRFVQRFDHVGGFVPRTGEKEVYLCALSMPYLSVTFPHELTHLIFREFAQDEVIPLWLNEGLAMYESGLIGYADEMLRDKVKAAKHIPLKEFVEMRDYPKTKEEAKLYYAQAEKTVELLITQHGRQNFSRFCKLLLSGQSFTRALKLVYGYKYYNHNEFKRAWIKYVLK